jgi:hypothetical protein
VDVVVGIGGMTASVVNTTEIQKKFLIKLKMAPIKFDARSSRN